MGPRTRLPPVERWGVCVDARRGPRIRRAVAGDCRVGVVGDAVRAHALRVVQQAQPRALGYPPMRAAPGLELTCGTLVRLIGTLASSSARREYWARPGSSAPRVSACTQRTRRCGLTEAPVRLGLPDDPQAASAMLQVAAANAMVSHAVGPGTSWVNFQSCGIDRPALRGVPVFSPGEGTAALHWIPVVGGESAHSCCMLERRRPQVDRRRDRENDAGASDHSSPVGAGRDREGGIGESGDAVLAHALRDLEHLGFRVRKARQQLGAGPRRLERRARTG